MELKVRNAQLSDLDEILKIYEGARAYMRETGNPTQWAGGYPQEAVLREDIAQNRLYVAVNGERIETVFVYFFGKDPTYDVIEGSWKNEEPYGVIHRIASRGEVKGAGAWCLQWGFSQCGNLKIDTHDENAVMQHVLEKNGFERCGRIYLEDGSPRVAFQKTEKSAGK